MSACSKRILSVGGKKNKKRRQESLTAPKRLKQGAVGIQFMNVNGYMDQSGTWHKYDDEQGNINKLLENYEYLQYGYYSDSDKDTMRKLFHMAK